MLPTPLNKFIKQIILLEYNQILYF